MDQPDASRPGEPANSPSASPGGPPLLNSAPEGAVSSRRMLAAGAMISLVLIFAAIFFALPRKHPVARKSFDPNSPYTDRCLYQRPDVLLHTKALSQIPDDLHRMPYVADLMKSALWEDVRTSEARLSLSGALYRIAFEKDLMIEDRLMKFLLDTPVEVALWGGYKGTLKDAMLVFTSSPDKDLLLKMAQVAAADTQLSTVTVYAENGDAVPALALEYAKERHLYLASADGHFFAFTNADCSLPIPQNLTTTRQDWLGYPKKSSLFLSKFPWVDDTHKHEIILSSSYLSAGYGSVLDALDVLRLTSDGTDWKMEVLEKDDRKDTLKADAALWSHFPQDAALCVQMPVNLAAVADIITTLKIVAEDKAGALHEAATQEGQAEAAVCWLKESAYFTPVFVVKRPKVFDNALVRLTFEKMIGGREGTSSAALPPFAVMEETVGAFTVLTREVSSEDGVHATQESVNATSMKHSSFFRVALGLSDGLLVFSPEKDNVTKILSVVSHMTPALAEKLPSGTTGSRVVLIPANLHTLMTREMEIEIADAYRAPVWARFMPVLDGWLSKPGLTLSWGDVAKPLPGGYVQRDLVAGEFR